MRRGARVGGCYRLTDGPLEGGMGEVWLAHDEGLGRNVALKRAKRPARSWWPGRRGAADADGARAEGRALARFSHPHVVTLYATVRVRELWRVTRWLVMEYLPDGDLDDRPPFPPRLAAHVGAQLADALEALHANGIVHCDVKPGNVIADGLPTDDGGPVGPAHGAGTRVRPPGQPACLGPTPASDLLARISPGTGCPARPCPVSVRLCL